MSSHNEQLGQKTESRVIRLSDGKLEQAFEANDQAPKQAEGGYRYAKF